MYIEPGMVDRVSALDRKNTKYTKFFGEILLKKEYNRTWYWIADLKRIWIFYFLRILFAYMNINWADNVRNEDLLQGVK